MYFVKMSNDSYKLNILLIKKVHSHFLSLNNI